VRLTLVLGAVLLLALPACDTNGPGTGGGPGRIAFTTNRYGHLDISAVDASGSNLRRLTTHLGADAWPTWSPDTTQIAFQSDRETGVFQIYVMSSDGSGITPLTDDTLDNIMPAWSYDGTRIAFASNRDAVFLPPPDSVRLDNFEIYVMGADGQNPVRLTSDAAEDAQAAWSPDGTKIAFVSTRNGNSEIYVMNASDGQGLVNLTNNVATDWGPSWSPDGTKIAFFSNRVTDFAVWVMDAAGTNPVQITNPTDFPAGFPDWSPDGTRIAYEQEGDVWVMRADGTRKVRITSGLGVADGIPRWRRIE
jgi:Tol biopolymer transport system component